MGGHGRSLRIMEIHLECHGESRHEIWKIMENHGRSLRIMETHDITRSTIANHDTNYGRSWKIMERNVMIMESDKR